MEEPPTPAIRFVALEIAEWDSQERLKQPTNSFYSILLIFNGMSKNTM